MESFFSSLKTERTTAKMYHTRAQAKADVFNYIECFYNPRRRHSTLGSQSHGVLKAGQISVSGCPPDRQQPTLTGELTRRDFSGYSNWNG